MSNIDEIKTEIVAFFVENKTDMEAIKPVLEILKANGLSNPNEIDDISFALEVLEMCK